MKIVYFAWVRESIGISSEEIDLPKDVKTIESLLELLSQKNSKYTNAFHKKNLLRFSINLEFADINQAIKNTDEVAIFPPVTGG